MRTVKKYEFPSQEVAEMYIQQLEIDDPEHRHSVVRLGNLRGYTFSVDVLWWGDIDDSWSEFEVTYDPATWADENGSHIFKNHELNG